MSTSNNNMEEVSNNPKPMDVDMQQQQQQQQEQEENGTISGSTTIPTTIISDNESDTSTITTNFIDFTPPPTIKIVPPAKYKLWLVVYVVVYFASWLTSEVNMLEFFKLNGYIDNDGASFLLYGLIVLVTIYSTIDLVIVLLTHRTKSGKVYGMEAFMKAPRTQWVYKHDNFIYQLSARIVHILEDGFPMFDAPPVQYASTTTSAAAAASQQHHHQFDCPNPNSEKILKIEHRIREDKLEDYLKWNKRIEGAIKQSNGVKIVSRSTIQRVSTMVTSTKDDNDVEVGGHKLEESVVPPKQQQQQQISYNDFADDALYQTIIVKFVNLDAMNDWMLNPRRKVLIDSLQPMLAVPDSIKIQKDRILPDAFTDLLIQQGGTGAQHIPPKKWKVWWLTVLSLFITIKWTNTFIPSYLLAWGLYDADERIQRIVSVFIITFINSYITSPLVLLFFDYWLNHHIYDSKHHNTKEPWQTLDNGLQSIWSKLLVSLLFFGGCIIGIVLKK